MQDGGYLRADGCRKFGQYADNFPSLFTFQFPDAVIGFYHFCRFNENGLACSRFIVYDASYLALHARSHRNDQPSVAHSRRHVFFHETFCLCTAQDAVQAAQRILEELALILEENQDILDNYPEGLQDSERVQAQIEAQSVMEESLGNLSSYMEEGSDYDVEDALMEIDEFEEAVEY